MEERPDMIKVDVESVARLDGFLKASPAVLARSGDMVSVTWPQLPPSPHGYVLGVYLAGDDVTTVAPIKYQPLTAAQHAGGSASFQVVNMRSGVVCLLFTGDIDAMELLAGSNTVAWANPTEPTGGHLALGADSSAMVVSWGNARGVLGQGVQYGFGSGEYTHAAAAVPVSYDREDLCGAPASTIGWRDPGALFHATLTSLPPASKVYYRFGSKTGGWSEEAFFTTLDPSASSVTMIAFGDMGVHHLDASVQHWDSPPSRNTSEALLARLNSDAPDAGGMVLHFGDISYAVGYAAQWEHFAEQIEPVARRIPWMVSEGNHERCWPGTGTRGSSDSGGECGVPLATRFKMPWEGVARPWYSFEYGPIHVSVLATEHDSVEQTAWLAANLAAVDRTRTPWVVVAMHRPMYVSSISKGEPWADQDVATVLRAEWETLLLAQGVDLVLAGHHHSYQRTCHLAHGKCLPPGAGGIVHILAGMAGFGTTFNVQEPQPEIFEVVDVEHHGFTTISASKDALVLRYYGGSQATLLDTFQITKGTVPAAA